jgi:type IV fimbrial biogenesis protein FimT
MNKQSGFTIVELMITVVIAGIVLAFGVPNFRQFMTENRTVTHVNNLITALNLARGEAITRGVVVDVRPLVAGDWTDGWVVGNDANNSNTLTGDEVFRVFGTGINHGTFTASGVVEFRSTGEVVTRRTFSLTPDECIGNKKRRIDIGASGHVDLTLIACP